MDATNNKFDELTKKMTKQKDKINSLKRANAVLCDGMRELRQSCNTARGKYLFFLLGTLPVS